MKVPAIALVALANAALPLSRASICGEGESRIFCENGGICRDGRADFSMYELEDGSYHNVHTTENDQVYCDCVNPEWTGIDCSTPVMNCADGEHFCLHGGDCVLDDSTESLYCDCSPAYDEKGNRYVGRWCEHMEKNHCEPDGDGFMFCLNGGECNRDFPYDGPPCDCEVEFEGPHCEYEVEDDLPECSLDCQNGGVCKLGAGTGIDDEYRYFSDSAGGEVGYDDGNNMYCDCPPGTHGELCEIDSVPCGEDRCYNGGICVTREVEGETVSHCNCNTAGDEDTRYAGRFCQYASNVICTDAMSLQGQLFCVNGGRCREDPYRGCECDEGFDGFACEFRVGAGADIREPQKQATIPPGFDSVEVTVCELDCNGHGFCRKGVKETESLGAAAQESYLNETYTDEFEHCVCDSGFVGLQCEHEVELCGENDDDPNHFCLHGGACTTIGEEGFACDCSTASSDLGESFTGEHCQNAQSSLSVPLSPSSEEETDGNNTDGRRNAGRTVVLVLLLVSIGVVGAVAAIKRVNRRRYYKEETTRVDPPDHSENLAPYSDRPYASSSSRDPMAAMTKGSHDDEEQYTKLFTGPPRDDDGNELHSVNII